MKPRNIDSEEINKFIKDILRYFEGEEDKDYETNQVLIGMKDLFCRYIIKVLKGANFGRNNYKELNKVTIYNYMKYYLQC